MTIKAQFPDEQSDEGEFERQEDAFRDWVAAEGPIAGKFPSPPPSPVGRVSLPVSYPAVAGRYHLYISLACPWAHRTLIVRSLKGLTGAIGVTVVDPLRDERGWAFRDGPDHTKDRG